MEARVPLSLQGHPIEATCLKLGDPQANAIGSGSSLLTVDAATAGYEAGHWLAMPCNHNLLSLLDPVEQGAEGVLGFEGSYFPHPCDSSI
jgi:hypothetical protein